MHLLHVRAENSGQSSRSTESTIKLPRNTPNYFILYNECMYDPSTDILDTMRMLPMVDKDVPVGSVVVGGG